MNTRSLNSTSFTIRIVFLCLIFVLAIIMNIVSAFKSADVQSSVQSIDKEIIHKAPEKPMVLDGVMVSLERAFILNKSEQARLRKALMHKPVKNWTALLDAFDTFQTKAELH